MRVWFWMAAMCMSAMANAQLKEWTLQDCIDTAITKNIDFEIAKKNGLLSREDLLQAKASKLPDLSFGAGQFVQSGRSIDRFTNQFTVQTIASNNFQLQSSAILYSGGQIRNQIAASENNTKASEEDVEFAKQNLSFTVANSYLQAIQAGEQKEISAQNVKNTKDQLTRIEKLYAAGALGEGDLINLQAQLANEEAGYVNATTSENAALTSLKLLLRIPGENKFILQNLNLGAIRPSNYSLPLQELYDTAIALRSDIKASEFRLMASKALEKSIQGSALPTLSIGANLNTVYSGNALEIESVTLQGVNTIGYVRTSLDEVLQPSYKVNYKTIGFSQQLRNNFGTSVGLNLSMPIYNKRQIKTGINKARINTDIGQLNLERIKQNLYNEIATAYVNFTNSKSRFEANKIAFELQYKNVTLNQKRFEAGQISEFDFQTTKNAYNLSNQNFIVAKYNYVFNRLVLDYYAGLNLSL
jgi:outer membrane protein